MPYARPCYDAQKSRVHKAYDTGTYPHVCLSSGAYGAQSRFGSGAPEELCESPSHAVTRFPEDVEIVTIGGRGGHSGVILPWALHSEGCVEPVALPDGKIALSIEDFKK